MWVAAGLSTAVTVLAVGIPAIVASPAPRSPSTQEPVAAAPVGSAAVPVVQVPQTNPEAEAVMDRHGVPTLSAGDVPPAALAAYQNTEVVMSVSRPDCWLGWSLLAGMGQVGTDHGRDDAHQIDEAGVVSPRLFGPRLMAPGGEGTPAADTDRGRYDGDKRGDRAMGPLLITPSAWASFTVDGDEDGVRNPQDVDDAGLAVGVALCSSGEDLSTTQGQRAALVGFYGSAEFADMVIDAARAYENSRREQTFLPATRIDPTPKETPSATPSPSETPTPTPTESPESDSPDAEPTSSHPSPSHPSPSHPSPSHPSPSHPSTSPTGSPSPSSTPSSAQPKPEPNGSGSPQASGSPHAGDDPGTGPAS